MANKDLGELLEQLEPETRERWEDYLQRVEAEVAEKGPSAAREHLEAALAHLLAVGWVMHRCYATDGSTVMGPLGDAATTVEELRDAIDQLSKKPEWSQ